MTNHTNAAPEPQPEKPTPDIFSDVANIRVDPTMSDGPSVTKVLAKVPVQKPDKAWFVRTHPDSVNYSLDALVLELKQEGEIYLIAPKLRDSLLEERCVSVMRLRLAVNRQGDIFVWPIRLPGVDGTSNSWNESALEVADRASESWVRLSANRRVGAYDIAVASISEDPRWPDKPFNDVLRIAFKGKVIDSLDHPVLRRLRGEV
jgi:hypothetical protein